MRRRRNDDRPNVNDEIRSSKVRLIRPDEEHEVVSIERALEVAASYDLDLVEVAPNAKPPVCKVIDFGKFMYEKKKKEKEAKKKQHTIQVKELRFRPNTDDHDLEFKTRHAREFLEGGDKVKATVQFRGRDMLYTEQGEELLNNLAEELDDVGKIESKPTMEGRRMIMIIAPDKS
ncbi:translation initiation factor IF-3 [Rhodohalobacter sulfatireducens]|uniref:translation initiation factor IF-3 n=1 Tax=Rhodohalobacter sulfatireducens TaxID=2911366 RepID=UPI0028728D7D|nr:translation initiation factor IF-3 [Balneolaceae bacterium]NBC03256.1 translation initiation factor IF-3 [Bacteroidota bacterium]